MAMAEYRELVTGYIQKHYREMYRPSGGTFLHAFLVPGSSQYADVLWDWDTFFANVALRQALAGAGPQALARARPHERGCIQNFLARCGMDGWIPPYIDRSDDLAAKKPADIYATNMHKPVLAQHAAFLVRQDGEAEWMRELFYPLCCFVNNYIHHHRHPSGLYYWQDDYAIGVDNDPCTFGRPPKSSASVFLNAMMLRELEAVAYLAGQLGLEETAPFYRAQARALRRAIQAHLWDARDGFYYSADLLWPKPRPGWLHQGAPPHWDTLLMRIGVWSGFLPMWAGVATPAQAERMVREHFDNPATFRARYGVRSLSKMEKMYAVVPSGNPSCWLGPVWGIGNYLCFAGLVRYGYTARARALVEETVALLGRDLEQNGAFHEYYEPDTGAPVLNRGFLNWNLLVLNMMAWYDGKEAVMEFAPEEEGASDV